jgi:D-sedoheptulose 7-phosphate isomerase
LKQDTKNTDKEFIKKTISESILVKEKISDQLNDTILQISKCISKVLLKNGTVYLFGNGGSAADSQHIAAEFVGRFANERRPLPAEALTTNTSTITAIGNDYNFSEIFSRQVKARVHPKDVVVGISTSGTSINVIEGLKAAKKIGAKTIGFTGSEANLMQSLTDYCLCIPSKSTPRIQEAHILVWHIVCHLVEDSVIKD